MVSSLGGLKAAKAAFSEGYNKRRTFEFWYNDNEVLFCFLARKRGGFILFFFSFPISTFLFLNFFLYSSSNYCVTKMYQIHQKRRIIVGCHLLGCSRCVFLWHCFLNFQMQLESVCSIDCCRWRERGEEYSCNKMKVTTACRSISNIPWPCVIGVW
jgi:hypothetical protein